MTGISEAPALQIMSKMKGMWVSCALSAGTNLNGDKVCMGCDRMTGMSEAPALQITSKQKASVDHTSGFHTLRNKSWD